MKLAILTLMCMGTAYVRGDCGDNQFAEYCHDDPNIAIIFCKDTACSCKINGEESADDGCAYITTEVMGDLTAPADLTGDKCEEICEASKSNAEEDQNKCEFFRWDKDASSSSTDSHCTLMKADQCTGFQSCQRGQCKSGQAGCDDGGVPDTSECAASVEFSTDPTAVHWQCLNPDNEYVNIYGTDPVPTGAHCWTAHRCKAFDKEEDDDPNDLIYANNIHVQCNPDKEPAGTTWGKFPGSKNVVVDVIDALHNKLVDPVCETIPDPLVLDAKKLHEPGVSFICDYDLGLVYTQDTVTVTAPNVCALLCNFHHAFTIENELDEYGNGVWNKYYAGSDEPDVVDEDTPDVKCWDFMKM